MLRVLHGSPIARRSMIDGNVVRAGQQVVYIATRLTLRPPGDRT